MLVLVLMLTRALSSRVERTGNAFGGSASHDDRIYLPSVSKLTFVAGTFTKSRRTDPRPQLACIGGNASERTDLYPNRVDCYNMGVDPANNGALLPSWQCIAAVSRTVTVADTTVNCEGWSSDDDLFVVAGSCWVTFKLAYEEAQRGGLQSQHHRHYGSRHDRNRFRWILDTMLNVIVIIIAALLLLWCFMRFQTPRAAEREPLITTPQNYQATSGS